ncbi:MAG: ACR family transporter [Rhizobiales bacterium 32-66-8]|nr:MAG: ACR family transporter [Rhizobiales bacterium 32-66-8]
MIYGFTADGFSPRELRDYVEEVRAKLLNVRDVSKIEVMGAQDERIFVEFSMAQLASLGIDRSAVIAALQAQNVVRPAGTVETGDEIISLRVSGAFETAQDVANVNFVVNGRVLRLSDIATVRRGQSDPPQPIFRVDGKDAIGLAIAMRDGGDILTLGRNITAAMREITIDLPLGIEPHLVADQAVTVDQSIDEFMSSLWQAIGIILVISFLALGVRAGMVVALSIPLTLAIVFAVMDLAGIDMLRISLGALIIALALMVDDAMTTTDAMLNRLAAGDAKEAAATFAFRTYAMAMLAGTFVTVAGFVPIGFAASSAGEYTFSLFAVVSIALIVSWFVATLFAPLLGVLILKAPARRAGAAPAPRGRVIRLYERLLGLALQFRWITIALTVGLFALSVLALPLIPRQFFPSSDRPELLVDLRLPQNASIYASDDLAGRFDAVLTGDPDVERWSTYVGRGAIRFYLPLNVQLPNDFFAQPPVGWPVQYRVSGPQIETVRQIAFALARAVAANPATERVNFDWIEPTREVRIRVDQDQARLLGLSTQALAGVLNTVMSGQPVTQVRDDIYLVDVIVRATDEQRVSLDSLATLQVPLPGGRTVPLSQLATFEYEQAYPVVWRRDRVPTLTVQADVVPGALPDDVVTALTPSIDALRKSLPRGYQITVGGTVEESAASQASVLAVVPVMLLLMFTVLIFQLQNFQRLVLVLSVAPLGLIGVVSALLLSGKPLGFVAILGVLALIGMITKNAVILIGQIEAERQLGKTVRDAVVAASCTRFTPIMLTAVSTVLGMIPIAPTVFWGPMAFAIMGGLLVGTLLTLIFLPALYVTWFGADAGPEPSAAPVKT